MVWKGVFRVLKGVLSVFEKNKQMYEISHPPSPAPVYEKNHKKSLILRRMASLTFAMIHSFWSTLSQKALMQKYWVERCSVEEIPDRLS